VFAFEVLNTASITSTSVNKRVTLKSQLSYWGTESSPAKAQHIFTKIYLYFNCMIFKSKMIKINLELRSKTVLGLRPFDVGSGGNCLF